MTEPTSPAPAASIRIFFWSGRVLVLGPIADLEIHAHHAVQAAVSPVGPFEIVIEDETVRTRAVLIEADRPHRLDSLGRDVAVFLIEPESVDAGRLRRGCLSTCGHHVVGPATADPVAEMVAILNRSDVGCGEASRCFERMLELWGGGPEPPPARDERIDDAVALIRALPEKKISLGELASHVHLSESRFIHLFTEQVGIPPRRYLLWARLMDALEASFRGDTLTGAAHNAGFADSAHLSRTFRRMFGRAPSFLSAAAKDSQFVQAFLCMGR